MYTNKKGGIRSLLHQSDPGHLKVQAFRSVQIVLSSKCFFWRCMSSRSKRCGWLAFIFLGEIISNILTKYLSIILHIVHIFECDTVFFFLNYIKIRLLCNSMCKHWLPSTVARKDTMGSRTIRQPDVLPFTTFIRFLFKHALTWLSSHHNLALVTSKQVHVRAYMCRVVGSRGLLINVESKG